MSVGPPPINPVGEWRADLCHNAAVTRGILAVAVTITACNIYDPGLSHPGAASEPDIDAARLATEDAAPPADTRPDRPLAPDVVADRNEPPGLAGAPDVVGCADGTREGFASVEDWPSIAGCSGAWQVPGATGVEGREPRCGREGGDSGRHADGQGCSIADLCAAGWHVCRDAGEVARISPTGCESAVVAGETRLFVVAAGASPQGICLPDPAAANDLHGCGSSFLGQPEDNGCYPLERRLGFADCAATGVWSCGTADDHLREAVLVTKRDSSLGGALCCRD
jgi:hypothetical protein